MTRTLVAGLVAVGVAFGGSASAQEQVPRERPGWPCVGRPDPAYFRTAEATGGQVFLFDTSEIGESSALMIASSHHPVTLFRVAGSLEEGVHDFVVPIDSTVESLLISVSLQCLQVADISTPDGGGLHATDPGVDYHQFQAGRIVTVASPAPGAWKVTVSGRGLFFLLVEAKTSLSVGANVVAPGRRLQVSLHGAARDVAFQLVSSEGQILRIVTLVPEEGSSAENRTFTGELPAGAREFRLQVTGVDPRGFPFTRMHAPLLMADRP